MELATDEEKMYMEEALKEAALAALDRGNSRRGHSRPGWTRHCPEP